jgi:hypothetical protein
MNGQATRSRSPLVTVSHSRPLGFRVMVHGRPLPPLRPGEIRQTGVGSDMMPPTRLQAATARVASVSALATAHRRAPMRGFVTGSSTTRLMMYTNIYGQVRRNGKIVPSVPTTLSWVITFRHSTPLVVGPHGFKRKLLPTLTCQYVAVVSAINGRQIDAYQICRPQH